MQEIQFKKVPSILAVIISNQNATISNKLKMTDLTGQSSTLKLVGVIYHGDFHFTSQVIDNNKDVWFNDGIETGASCDFKGKLRDVSSENLNFADDGRKAVALIYHKLKT